MTTTAHEDQFTDAPEPVIQPYDTGSILRRNVADLEIALRKQTERAEAAEAELLAVREDNHSMMLEIDGLRKELAKMRNQKPALYVSFSDCGNFIRYWTRDTKNLEATMAVNDFEVLGFYAAPVPAVAAPLTTQADCRACVNRGRVNGLSQETYCESCVHEGRNWRKNHFLDAVADRLLEGGE